MKSSDIWNFCTALFSGSAGTMTPLFFCVCVVCVCVVLCVVCVMLFCVLCVYVYVCML